MELRHKSALRVLGRILSGIAVCSLLAFSLLPIPLLLPESVLRTGHGVHKDLSVPFPCMHRRCGCKSAAQCAKQCCCFPARKKPKLALSINPELCSLPSEEASQQNTPQHSARSQKNEHMQVSWVDGPQFSVCHGQSSLWLCVPVALVPENARISQGAAPPNDAHPLFSDNLLSAEQAEPVPPPKLG